MASTGWRRDECMYEELEPGGQYSNPATSITLLQFTTCMGDADQDLDWEQSASACVLTG